MGVNWTGSSALCTADLNTLSRLKQRVKAELLNQDDSSYVPLV